jgi:hypothetical protein
MKQALFDYAQIFELNEPFISNTNTILYRFAMHGIIPGSFYLYKVMRFSNRNSTIFSNFILFLGFFVILSGENFTTSLFFSSIFFLEKKL